MAERCTISSVVPFLVAQAAATIADVDARHVLGGALSSPPRPDEHVDIERYFEVWARAVARVKDDAFPLRVAAKSQLEDSEVFGFLAMSCETLGEAYDKTAAYRALYGAGARWEQSDEPKEARLIWYPWPGSHRDAGYRAAMDFGMADMANSVRRLGRSGPRPVAVHLCHAAPANIAPYREFYGVDPKFNAKLYELVYAPGLRDEPIATFNSKLRNYFDEECKKLAVVLGGGSTVAQVRKVLMASMNGGDTSIEATAKALAMSPRSLQRRLADEGSRYNDLLAEIRAELAKRYLARGTISVTEVAYLLGFAEPPAFFKAFKRWTGMTPRAFQEGATTH
ncbi:MAG: AraC family transcriptional regulator ligand-binding domain-containing protein [Myxococcales bacterium]|nr:AraC family transcriptional regulator ligand-binding domain-containing protein [Myxococcales bacterium]